VDSVIDLRWKLRSIYRGFLDRFVVDFVIDLACSTQVTAEYEIHGNRTLARMEAVEGEEHYSWSLGMDDNQATLVVLEDKGDSFLATAMSVFPDETKNSKVVRSGSWDELPDALSFGLIAG
jgi:hypothetical protein